MDYRSGHRRRRLHPRLSVPRAAGARRHLVGLHDRNAVALRGGRRAQLLYRPRRDPQRHRHVRDRDGSRGGRLVRRRGGGEDALDDEVDEPVLHVDHLFNLLPVDKLLYGFISERTREHVLLRHAARHREPRPKLAVHLDGDFDITSRGEVLVVGGPPSPEDRALVTQDRPQLFRDMRGVGRQHDYERRDQLPAPRSLLPQLVHVLHHRRDRRVVLQRFGIGTHLTDRAMQLLRNGVRRPPPPPPPLPPPVPSSPHARGPRFFLARLGSPPPPTVRAMPPPRPGARPPPPPPPFAAPRRRFMHQGPHLLQEPALADDS